MASVGERQGQAEYHFTDSNPVAGDDYYRLKMVDRDGSFAFSQIRKVLWEGGGLAVFPNPAVDRLEVRVKDWSKVAKIKILDAAGSVLQEGPGAGGLKEKHVSLDRLGAGSYILAIEYRDGSSERTHFVKH